MYKRKKTYRGILYLTPALFGALLCLFGKGTAYAQEGFVEVAQNDEVILYYEPSTLAIQVENKQTGLLYSSRGQTPPQEGDLNNTWQGMMDSAVSIDVRQPNGSSKTWSISNQEVELSTSVTENGFESDITFPEGMGLHLSVALAEDGLSVSVPADSVTEKTDTGYSMQNIYLYPFLGATYGLTEDGYLFVPDGSGALIDTTRATLSTEPYEKQVYGSDIGMGTFQSRVEASMLKDVERIYVPVFGSILATGQDGVAVIVDQGAEYCHIVAYASGIRTPYNMIMPKFLIHETYQMKVSQSGASMVANQPVPNHYDISLVYRFLSGEEATYVGLAKAYQSYLVDAGVLTGKEAAGGSVPMKLEILLAEKRDELLWSTTVPMTTCEQADTIVRELYDAGIQDMDVVLRGYGKDGSTGAAPTKFQFTGKTGSKGDWKKFIQTYAALGVDVSLYADFSRGYDGMGGYSNAQKVQAIDQTLLQTFDYARFTWLTPTYAAKRLGEFAKKSLNLGVGGLAVDAYGTSLYSNWNKKDPVTRQEAVEAYRSADLGALSMALYSPAAFLFDKADAAYDIPEGSSDYYIFTDTVPFLQIVLKGYLPYYSSAWNFHADADKELLKCVDYGMYPNWYVTWEDPIELINTPSNWLYSSQYSIWKDAILSRYERINEALRGVMGCQVTNRETLSRDVVRIDYSNGTSIYVNYGDKPWEDGNVSVDREDFLVELGGAS